MRPFRQLTGMDTHRKVVIMIPERPAKDDAAEDTQIHGNVHVTFHDMLAVNYAERVLVLAGHADSSLSVQAVSQQGKGSPRASVTDQMVLVCSPRANPLTREALDALAGSMPRLGIRFSGVGGSPERWQISIKGADYLSPTYSQIPTLRESGQNPANGPLTDYALLGRFRNHWNPELNVLMIAGIRGIGTWGAARHLRDNAESLKAKFGRNEFLAVIEVKYQDYKIIETALVNEALLSDYR